MNGNYCFDEDVPKIYPYHSREDKKIAMEIGKRLGVWSETSDIEGVVLSILSEPFSIITKDEAKEYEKVLQAEEEERVAARKARDKELEDAKRELKRPKKEVVEPIIEAPVVVEVVPEVKVEPKIEVVGEVVKEAKTRGRKPRNIFED
jgi:hypothetical protein